MTRACDSSYDGQLQPIITLRTCLAVLLSNVVSEMASAGQLCDLIAPPFPATAWFPLKALCAMLLIFALAPQPIRVIAPPLLDVLFWKRDDVMVKLEPVIAYIAPLLHDTANLHQKPRILCADTR